MAVRALLTVGMMRFLKFYKHNLILMAYAPPDSLASFHKTEALITGFHCESNQIGLGVAEDSRRMRRFTIAASDVAGICDMHDYQTPIETVVKFLRTNLPLLYARLKTLDVHNRRLHWSVQGRRTADACQTTLAEAIESPAKFDELVSEAKTQGASDEGVRRSPPVVYTARGTRDECKGINAYESKASVTIQARNTKTYRTRSPSTPRTKRSAEDAWTVFAKTTAASLSSLSINADSDGSLTTRSHVRAYTVPHVHEDAELYQGGAGRNAWRHTSSALGRV